MNKKYKKALKKQAEFQLRIQEIGVNLVCCCSCETIFFHTSEQEILTCYECGASDNASSFSDLYY